MSDLIDAAPKSWRPMILAGTLLAIGAGGMVWASAFVQKSATEAAAPLKQKVEDHEKEDAEKWVQVQTELDSIQRDVADEKTAVVGLNAWIHAQESEATYAGKKHH